MSKTSDDIAVKPLYDINKTYAENLQQGPQLEEKPPKRTMPPASEWYDFLGTPVASRIGVPAGPLLSSEWIRCAAQLGYDIVTYKTIRSTAYAGHPLPNILFVDSPTPLGRPLPDTLHTTADLPDSTHPPTITNSFGMPSPDENFLKQDIPRAQASLAPGQALVVSITGSPDAKEGLFEDFANTAQLAVECGAGIVEANFSCPNVKSAEGSLYLSHQNAAETIRRIKSAIGDVPLIIKVGIFPDYEALENLLLAAADAGVSAISGINTISMKVIDHDGQPALGPDRPTSGICGAAIHPEALHFVKQARKAIDKHNLSLTLIGVGGITRPEHFQQMLDAGADFAQTATGMMWDPFLAMKHHKGDMT